MEVFKSLLGLCVFAVLFSSCAPKTESSVDATVDAASCGGLIFQNRFIVEWEDGHTSIETAENVEKFKSEFVKANLENIKRFHFDQEVQFLKQTDLQAAQPGNVQVSTLADPPTYWGQEKVQTDVLWNQGIKGAGVTVGVVDAYVQLDHPQLKTRLAVNAGEIPGNGIDDDNNGIVDDYYAVDFRTGENAGSSVSQHGTHVAGIIAGDSAVSTAEPGSPAMKGMAPEAKIIPAPFILNSGSGSLSDAISALKYVASRGAQIINNSWGGAGCEGAKVLQGTFLELEKKGILLTVAAGNETADVDTTPSYPAAFNLSTQITVAASNYDDVMSYFSNSGNRLVHIAAPGEKIYSTIPVNRYSGTFSGTSMASPFVAGAAALLKSARPQATALQIKQALLTSTEYRPSFPFRVSSRGRMNVAKALQQLKVILGE